MKNKITFLLFIFIIGLSSCSHEIKESQINGEIKKATVSEIKMGNQTIPVSPDGKFVFKKVIERPTFIDVSYNNIVWTLFLKPECNFNILISGTSLDSIEYTGDLISTNKYILEASSLSDQLNSFFSANWVKFYSQNQEEYISTLDSLKGVYLNHLTSDSKRYKTLSHEFIKVWKAEINFGFNGLVLQYPTNHFNFTKNKVKLNQNTLEYLKSSEIDNLDYFDLSSYKSYTKAWINYQSDILVEKDSSLKNYNLKKIEAALVLIPEIFTNQYLKDFWIAEFLKEHIDNNGISNSEKYINQFNTICKIEVFKNEVDQFVKQLNDERKDHEVRIYKTENDFNLELHIFKPKDFIITEKRPAIAIFHGGGWISGNSSWAFESAKHYSDLGMIGIAVQYRLSNYRDITPIEAMQDAKDVFLWLRTHADSLGIISNKIAGEGWSAGGHLVVSTAIFADTILGQNINSAPNALILTSPALDIDSKNDDFFKQLLGISNVDPNDLSPIEKIKEGLPIPPTLILQGRTDRLTPTVYAQLFHDKMTALKYSCELVIYENCGHLFTPSYIDDRGWPQPDKEISKKADKKADDFLKELGFTVE